MPIKVIASFCFACEPIVSVWSVCEVLTLLFILLSLCVNVCCVAFFLDPLVFVTSLFAEYGGDVKTTNETKSKARVLLKHTSASPGDKEEEEMGNVEERLGAMRRECRRQLKALTYQHPIWYRREEENTATFTKAYGVIEEGSLFLYKDKDEYESFHLEDRTEDMRPLKLIRFELETNKKAIEHLQVEYSSLRNSARQMLFGTSALCLKVMPCY
jgi:hypothetical protein